MKTHSQLSLGPLHLDSVRHQTQPGRDVLKSVDLALLEDVKSAMDAAALKQDAAAALTGQTSQQLSSQLKGFEHLSFGRCGKWGVEFWRAFHRIHGKRVGMHCMCVERRQLRIQKLTNVLIELAQDEAS